MPTPEATAGVRAAERRGVQLTATQRIRVREIVNAAVPKAQVFLFGSRASAKARPFSDLDLLFVRPGRLRG